MKTFFKLTFITIIIGILSSCATELKVNYQVDNENTGTLVIKPTGGYFKGATLTLNNNEVIRSGGTIKKITVNNIPKGEYQMHFISTHWGYTKNIDEKENIKIVPYKITERTYAIPPYNTGWWIYQGCVYTGETMILILSIAALL